MTANGNCAGNQRGKPFAKGADPRRQPGQKGVAGRKTLEFKAECARLADEEVLPKLTAYLASALPDDPAWRWAAQTVLEYSKQKAAQDVTLNGDADQRILVEYRKPKPPEPEF